MCESQIEEQKRKAEGMMEVRVGGKERKQARKQAGGKKEKENNKKKKQAADQEGEENGGKMERGFSVHGRLLQAYLPTGVSSPLKRETI